MKNLLIPAILVFVCTSCTKTKENATPVADTHSVTFSSTGSGYSIGLRLQKNNEPYQQSIKLDSLQTTSSLYMYKISLKSGEHLLISVEPGVPPEAVLRYAINDNGLKTDSVNIGNIAQGSQLIYHYPKD